MLDKMKYCSSLSKCQDLKNKFGQDYGDEFMLVYCSYKLNDYMKRIDPKWEINSLSKNYDFNPTMWSLYCPECSCYGDKNYSMYH